MRPDPGQAPKTSLCPRRKSQQAEREYEKIKSQLEGLEESVRDRCKKEFTGRAALQGRWGLGLPSQGWRPGGEAEESSVASSASPPRPDDRDGGPDERRA